MDREGLADLDNALDTLDDEDDGDETGETLLSEPGDVTHKETEARGFKK